MRDDRLFCEWPVRHVRVVLAGWLAAARVYFVLVENNAGAFDAEIRQDAIDILGDLRESYLPPATWARVDEALARMTKAVADGDQAEVRSATIDLELLSPRRTDPLGAMDEKPPKETHDEIVDLIHALGGDKDAQKGGKTDKPSNK